ncbi:MAG: MarR family winged helix-turn-helix transcriptional regulator [Prevotellaceae bacterium]|jgi:DNA-binding MarR family transcriptional regulator|nr:MarR family winged helix-turn-helix transcriptional regulator [Prevotellaceae bacterium]
METNIWGSDISLGLTTERVLMAINRNLSRGFRAIGLEITPEQCAILVALWDKDEQSQQELCNLTYKDKPSMTRLLDNLQKQELVVRVASKCDRRTNLIHLTAKGKKLREKVHSVVYPIQQKAIKGIPRDKVDLCFDVLKTAFKNLVED